MVDFSIVFCKRLPKAMGLGSTATGTRLHLIASFTTFLGGIPIEAPDRFTWAESANIRSCGSVVNGMTRINPETQKSLPGG